MWGKIIGIIILVIVVVIAVNYEGKQAFEKPLLSFRFDDCYSSQLTAHKILKEHNLTATFYCITDRLDEEGYMKWSDAKHLYDHGFEIGSHTRSHMNFLMLTLVEQREEIVGSRNNFLRQGIKATTFAYPYGIFNPFYMKEVKAGYRCACIYPLFKGAFNYKNTNNLMLDCLRSIKTAEQFEDNLNKAINKSAWMVVCFHRIGDEEGKYYVKEEDFREIVKVAKEYQDKGLIDVVTISQACSELEQD